MQSFEIVETFLKANFLLPQWKKGHGSMCMPEGVSVCNALEASKSAKCVYSSNLKKKQFFCRTEITIKQTQLL